MSFLETFFCLKDKVVFITGSNGQLGRCIAEHFNNAGAIVIGSDMDEKSDSAPNYYSLDITHKENTKQVLSNIYKRFGKIDTIINNAGVSTFKKFEERSEEDFNWVMDVNLKGTFNCIQSYVNLFDEHKCSKGSIINIASIFGMVSPDFRNYTDCDRNNSEVYGATKAGLIQMTKYFACHLAKRPICVNAISPGGIFNPKNPQGEGFIQQYSNRVPMDRMANDQEMIGALFYLASDSASYTTGQNITIDGGMTSW
tara:strand:- start:10669 stop:11433 length:765 start_codon:yes stop_codon:yes gene_type:complete